MSSISSFIIHGNLGNDWNQEYQNVYKNTIFVNDKRSGENRSQMFPVSAFGSRGETLSKWTKKGQCVLLKCILEQSTSPNGNFYLNVVVRGFDFCGVNKSDDYKKIDGQEFADLFTEKEEIVVESEKDKILWD